MQNDFAAPDGATLERSMASAKGIMTSPPHDGDWFCQWLLTMVDLPRLALAHGVGDAGQVELSCVYEAENDCLSIEVYYETSHIAKMTVPLHSVRDFELNTRSFAATLGMPMFVPSFADRTETKWTRNFKEWLKGSMVAIVLKNRNGNGGPTPMVDVMVAMVSGEDADEDRMAVTRRAIQFWAVVFVSTTSFAVKIYREEFCNSFKKDPLADKLREINSRYQATEAKGGKTAGDSAKGATRFGPASKKGSRPTKDMQTAMEDMANLYGEEVDSDESEMDQLPAEPAPSSARLSSPTSAITCASSSLNATQHSTPRRSSPGLPHGCRRSCNGTTTTSATAGALCGGLAHIPRWVRPCSPLRGKASSSFSRPRPMATCQPASPIPQDSTSVGRFTVPACASSPPTCGLNGHGGRSWVRAGGR